MSSTNNVFYELWDYECGNLLRTYETLTDALAEVRRAVADHGREYVMAWALGRGNDEGFDEPVLDGEALIDAAMT
jgi:hypothetical protein